VAANRNDSCEVQRVAVSCSELKCVAVDACVPRMAADRNHLFGMQCVVVCCSVLQCFAVRLLCIIISGDQMLLIEMIRWNYSVLQHATHCNTRHVTYMNTPRHMYEEVIKHLRCLTVAHCNTLQHVATCCNTL